MQRPASTATSLLALAILLAAQVAAGGDSFAGDRASKEEPFPLKKREIALMAKVADFERMLARHGYVHDDPGLRDYVTSVGLRVIPRDFTDDRVQIRFHVMRSPEANAFALPNGSIYVTLGLLSLLENEAQLASVLAHEVTHATRYHYFLFDRQYKAKSMALNLFSVGALAVGGWGGLLAGLGAEALYVGTIFGYSRDLEEEADRMGLDHLDAAGYDVGQAPASFRRLLVDYEGLNLDTPVFYSSHPKLKARIEYTEERIAREGMHPDPARSWPDRYAVPREHASREEVRLALVNDLPRTAIATADHLVERHPDSAEARALRGDGFRTLGYRRRDVTTDPPDDVEKKRLLSEKQHRTPEEIEEALAGTEEGRQAWAANAASAEEDYRRALALDPQHPGAHLGLALLYEKLGRSREALEETDEFLRLAPGETLQRARARRLKEEIEKRLAPKPEGSAP